MRHLPCVYVLCALPFAACGGSDDGIGDGTAAPTCEPYDEAKACGAKRAVANRSTRHTQRITYWHDHNRQQVTYLYGRKSRRYGRPPNGTSNLQRATELTVEPIWDSR